MAEQRWRTLLVALALSAGLVLLARPLARAMLPLFECVVAALQSDYHPVLRVTTVDGEAVIAMRCLPRRTIPLAAGGALPVGSDFDGGATHVMHVVMPIALYAWTIVACCTVGTARPRPWRVASGAVLILCLTTPPLLAGRVEHMLASVVSPADPAAQARALDQVMLFLESGGRWLLAIVVGASAMPKSMIARAP